MVSDGFEADVDPFMLFLLIIILLWLVNLDEAVEVGVLLGQATLVVVRFSLLLNKSILLTTLPSCHHALRTR